MESIEWKWKWKWKELEWSGVEWSGAMLMECVDEEKGETHRKHQDQGISLISL
jgi:hypothetical protein